MRILNQEEIKALKKKLERNREEYGAKYLRTAIYARKSTPDEHETSLSTQIALCTEFIKKYDFLQLSATFQEDDRSGMFTDNREQFLQMLERVKKHEIDVIVVLRLDRLGRNLADMLKTINTLNSYGCALLAGDDVFDASTPVGEFMRTILLGQNQYQARVTASRVMQSEIHNVQSGTSAGGQPPYGLKIIDKCYYINEEEAPAVRTMFSMAANGKSYKEIIDKLTSLGYKTRKGRKFTFTTLNAMLRNEKYYGTYIYNRENGKRKSKRVLIENFDEVRNENAIPAIISKAIFDKVQKTLNARKQCLPHQNSSPEYILTGFITCEDCGSSMSGQSNVGGRSKKRTRLYVCPNHLSRHGKKCGTKSVNAEYLETAVKEILTAKINEYLSTANADSIFKALRQKKNDEAITQKRRVQRTRKSHPCFA